MQMKTALKQPLTNVQLELLKTFSYQLSSEDIIEFKKNIATFFSKKLIKEADKVWDEKKFDDSKVEELLNTKLRTSK